MIKTTYLGGLVADIYFGWNKAWNIARLKKDMLLMLNYDTATVNDLLSAVPHLMQDVGFSDLAGIGGIPSYDAMLRDADNELISCWNRSEDNFNEFYMLKDRIAVYEKDILQYKKDLSAILKRSILRLFIIQFTTSSLGSVFAHLIGGLFGLSAQSVLILRILFFAAGFQVLFLYTIIFMMYFDLSRLSFYMVLIFFLLNAGLNLFFIYFPVLPLGFGYLISIGVSFIIGLILLLYSVSDIEYKIFMRQEN